jgi:hypothetical protein
MSNHGFWVIGSLTASRATETASITTGHPGKRAYSGYWQCCKGEYDSCTSYV